MKKGRKDVRWTSSAQKEDGTMEIAKEKVYTNVQASVADFGFNKYQTQWQRISQMQQNASILLAIISFSITVALQIVNIQKNSKPILDDVNWSAILLPSILVTIGIGIISAIFLFKVIISKTIKNDLPLPLHLYKEIIETLECKILKTKDDNESVYISEIEPPRYIAKIICDKISVSILEINRIVEKNQLNYTKGLIISIFSICINIISYILIICNLQLTSVFLTIWYGINIITASVSLSIAILYGIQFAKKPEEEKND